MWAYAQPREGYLVVGAAVQEDSPTWLNTASADVEEMITKAAKKGQMPSQIGVLLRDQHGIPLVKSVTGSKILRILKAHGLAPETCRFEKRRRLRRERGELGRSGVGKGREREVGLPTRPRGRHGHFPCPSRQGMTWQSELECHVRKYGTTLSLPKH